MLYYLNIVGSDGTTLAGGGEGGNIYRCGADGDNLVRIATGFWNPFHLCYDAFGRLFAVDNDPDSRPPCRLLHIVPDGDYGYRFRNGRKGLHPFTAWNGELPGTLPMVAGTGEAPSGIVAYEAGNLPDDYRGDLLVTSWGDHRLDRFKLVPRGASFTSNAKPFVIGGENFRPVGIAVAPDGSLYVSDWVDKSYTLHGKGRIWRVRGGGPVLVAETDDPMKEIESPFRDRRERAARKLLEQKEAGLAKLRKLYWEGIVYPDVGERVRRKLRQARPWSGPRVSALALEALASVNETKDLVKTVPGRRFWQSLPANRNRNIQDVVALTYRWLPGGSLMLDFDQFGDGERWLLARGEALRRSPSDERRPLEEALRDHDPFLRQAALVGLKRSATIDELARYVTNSDSAIRLAALLVLREANDRIALAALSRFFDDTDPSIRFAAVQWVGEHALREYRPQVEEALAKADTRQLFEGCLAALELLDRAAKKEGQPPPGDELAGEEYIARVLVDPARPLGVRRHALRMLRPDHPSLTHTLLEELFATGDEAMQLEVVRTLRESPLAERTTWLSSIVADTERPVVLRAEAIVGLVSSDPLIIEQLVGLARGTDPTLRDEALRSLRGAPFSEEQRERLQHLDKLRRLDLLDEYTSDLVLRALRTFVQSTTPPPDDTRAWLKHTDGDADAAAGERIFFHPRAAGCYRCHQINGRGGRMGPELSSAARQLDRAKLIEAIVEPSKEIAPRFVPWSIVTTDGKALTGLLVSESATGEQTYADSDGGLFVLRPEQIDERVPHSKSIMPDNLADQITPRELRDLLAFLQGKRP